MLRITAGFEDLARSRFAISPLWELVQALRRLTEAPRRQHSTLRPWLERTRGRYQSLRREVDVDALLALQPPGYGADFLSPPPTGAAAAIGDYLDLVRSTPLAQVHAEVDQALQRQPRVDPRIRAVLTGDQVIEHLLTVLGVAWEALVAPDWPVLRAILDRDLVHRAGQLVSHGWAEALADIHPRSGGVRAGSR